MLQKKDTTGNFQAREWRTHGDQYTFSDINWGKMQKCKFPVVFYRTEFKEMLYIKKIFYFTEAI